jgi:RimJ/RimL family protein N-acetyltransferase
MADFPTEQVTGGSIVLRPLRDDDIDDLVLTCNDEQTHRFLPQLPRPYTRRDGIDWVHNGVPKAWSQGGAHYAIADPTTDRYLGTFGLSRPTPDGHAISVGYMVAPWTRGNGVATAALRTGTDLALRHNFGRIELTTDQTNEPSQRVALAAGFTHEGIRRGAGPSTDGTWRDIVAWARLATDSGERAARPLPDLPAAELTDGVVTLRRLRLSDADDVYALSQLPEVIATTVSDTPPTRESAVARCAKVGYFWLIGARADLAICDAVSGAFAGHIGLFTERPTGQAMIGYDVAREWRRRGFASRATRLLADWSLDHAGIARVVAGAAPDNIPSQRTLERAGLHREGYERSRLPGVSGGPRIDNVLFAMLPSDREPV